MDLSDSLLYANCEFKTSLARKCAGSSGRGSLNALRHLGRRPWAGVRNWIDIEEFNRLRETDTTGTLRMRLDRALQHGKLLQRGHRSRTDKEQRECKSISFFVVNFKL